MRLHRTAALLTVLAAATAASAGELSLTVYSTADPAGFNPQQFIAQQRRGHNPQAARQVPGFGVVRDERPLRFEAGTNTVSFTDVAAFIDPTTVSLKDLTAPEATEVLEQQFLFDLVSSEKVFEKYVDREITVHKPIGGGNVETITGRLLSARDGLIIRTDDGLVHTDAHEGRVEFGELPGGLITKPTLRWLIESGRAGRRQVRTTYQTDGLTWRADYNLTLSADETEADLGAWVTLMNLSGASYPEAKLKLIAGDVRRVEPDRHPRRELRAMAATAKGDRAGFEEKSFYEYHLYTLPRRTDVPQNSTKQITLFPTARNASVEKQMVYYGAPVGRRWGYGASPRTQRNLGNDSNKKVDVYLRFDNRERNNLGMPLPRGKVRVYKQDPDDGTLEFIGEDLIDHTPKNETVRIKTGQAFDVVGERTQTDFSVDTSRKVITESFEIELRNHKEEDVDVIVRESLYRWSNWRITEQSDEHEKVDYRTIHFPVTVPAGGEKTVTYTVRYTW